MKVSTFHSLVLGALCLSVAGLAAVSVTQHRQLQTFAKTSSPSNDLVSSAQLSELSERQNALQTSVAELRKAVSSVTGEQTAQSQRLEQLDAAVQALGEQLVPSAVDTGPLEQRVLSVEQRLVQLNASVEQRLAASKPAMIRHTAQPKPAAVVTPPTAPFALVGLEARGPERFLSVLPAGDQYLRSVRLLQPGESLGGWQLRAVSADAAVFAVPGYADQRIALPTRATP